MSLTYLFLSAYHLVACTLQHMEDIEQYTEEESRLHHLDFPVLFEVSLTSRGQCATSMQARLQLPGSSAGGPALY